MKTKLTCLILALVLFAALCGCSPSGATSPTPLPSGTPPWPAGRASLPPATPTAPAPQQEPAHASGMPPFGAFSKDDFGIISSESYLAITENPEVSVAQESTLTFSLKVDTASYSNVERYLESGNLPPADAVRVEEMVNYFSYDGEMAFGEHPLAVYAELGRSPYDAEKYLAFVRVKAQDIDKNELPRSNLVFLIDTSGSMESYDKLPLLKEAFTLLIETLTEDDRVSIVTYAGSSAIVLDSVPGNDYQKILNALQNLSAGGSTAGGQGILSAYKLAEKNFIEGGNNRVILATDGDFNVGVSTTSELETLVSEKRGNGVYLSILGFGTGNIRDDIMETLSKHGNGNYAYINSVHTAEKVLVDELSSNLFVIADDVKAQVEFNPENVVSYRLLGYENRQLANEDFTDDTKDAGEIGVGTDVVALFELTLRSEGQKYGNSGGYPDELFEVRLRYKHPGENESIPITVPVRYEDLREANSSDFHFAAAVAGYGQLLRGSSHAGLDVNGVLALAQDSLGIDEKGYRQEFVAMVKNSRDLF